MARKKKSPPEDVPLTYTMPQTVDAQKASQQLSELKNLKQHPDAPKISGYMLLKPIGRGAYAEVWEAVQLRTRKFVAVKIFTKKTGVHWFYLQREADRLVRLDKHPNIVSLLDADLSGEIPYYVMDLLQEGSLEHYVQSEKPVEADQAADWIEEIAQALNYVHAKQMVHCDLKPANVLLDEEGHVRVADFGHSRVLSESGGALGTLFFMAPEQAVMPDQTQALQPNVQWDIYALGCTAYALLANHIPHEEISDKLEMAKDLGERLRIYREAVEQQPTTDLFALTKGKVDRDLSAIIAKCMRTRPEERYSSIQDILKDLKNRREGKPVSPLAHDKGYWIEKFILRFRVSVAIGLAAFGVVLGALYFNSKHQQVQIQDTAFNYVLRGKEFLDKDDAASALAYFAESNRLFPTLLARGNAALHMPPIPTHFFAHDGGIVAVLYSPNGKILLTGGGPSGAKLWNAATGQLIGKPLKMDSALTAVAFNKDGSKVILGDSEGEAQVFNVATQKPIGKLLEQDKEITSVSFNSAGDKVLTASADGTARVWNAATGELLKPSIKHSQGLYRACFSPQGDEILTAGKDGTARLWDSGDGHPLCNPIKLEIKDAPAWYKPDVAFNPNGRTFITTGWDGGVRFYNLQGRHSGSALFLEGIGAKALYSPDGRQLLTSVVFGGAVGLARLWNTRTHSPSKFSLKNTGKVTVLAFSQDGSEVLTGGTDHVARLWDAKTGEPLGRALWHGDSLTAAAFNPNGGSLATGSKDGLAFLWNPDGSDMDSWTELEWKKSGREHYRKLHNHALFSPDLNQAFTYGGKTACLWDTSSGQGLGKVLLAGGTILRALFSPDGQSLLTCDADNEARLWDLKTEKSMALPHDGAVRGGAFSADGKKLLTGGEDKTLRLWETDSGQEWGKALNTGFPVVKVLLSPDGRKMAALGTHGVFALYPVQKDGAKTLASEKKGVENAGFSSDSRYVLLTLGRQAILLDTDTGKKVQSFDHGLGLASASMGPDGRTVATLGSDGTIRLWDVKTGLPIGNPLKHEGSAQEALFSPKGGALLVTYMNGGWQLWDTRSGESIGDEVKLGTLARAIGFEPNGKSFSLLGQDGSVTRLDADWLDPQTNPQKLILATQLAGWCKVNSQGSLDPVSADQWVKLWNQYRKESK